METLVTYGGDDLHQLHTYLGSSAAMEVKLLAQGVAHFLRAKDKAKATAEVVAAIGEKAKGISMKSLYRKAEKFRSSDGRLVSLVDGRKMRKALARGLAKNTAFVEYWQTLCLQNKRATAPAYRCLMANLAAGCDIPGFGDWKAIWALEHCGMMPGDDMACPYQLGNMTPEGWTERNLRRLQPSAYALQVARMGTMAAAMTCIPDVIRTRVGLAPCQCVQIDDMWYEHKVSFDGNKHAQRVVEFAMIDVLTGHVISYLTKPVREREDGTRETLKSKWTRYLIAHLLCDVGIPQQGTLIMGEHGTAAADNDLLETLQQVSGGRVKFGAGGLLSQPIAKGLFDGRPKGNPRYKGLLEGFHSLIKNELAAVDGMVGGGRDKQAEWVYGMDKIDERYRGIALALTKKHPGILERLRLPYIPYTDFMRCVHEAYDRLDRRVDHRYEGWEACGFVTGEFRLEACQPWTGISALARMPEAKRIAIEGMIKSGVLEYRQRKMSPGEAWKSRASELDILDPVVATLVMGPTLARTCVCDKKLQLHYKDPETLADCKVAGVLAGGGTLTRGDTYQVWINPLSPLKAYVCDLKGRFIGVAPVQEAAMMDDKKAQEKQLGIRMAAIAEERKRLEPFVRQQLREQNEIAAQNARVILGADPAVEAAEREAAALEIERVPVKVRKELTDDDFMPVGSESPVPESMDFTDYL